MGFTRRYRKEIVADDNDTAASERGEQFRGLTADVVELAIHVGMMGSAAHEWPREVQENWDERVVQYRRWANQQILEIQQFAESYDGP